jgi:recombination protein RecA
LASSTKPAPLSLDDYLAKQYGDGLIQMAAVHASKPQKIIQSSLSLDIALNGGIPEGDIVLLTGKAKLGKTTLALTILRNAHLQYGKPIYYVDIERRGVENVAKTIPNFPMDALQIVRSTPEHQLEAHQYLDIVERLAKSVPGCVIVVDSLSMMSTASEIAEDVGANKDMAGVPKLMASFIRRMIQIVDSNNCVLICLSQLQTNRDPTSRTKWVEKGGLAVQYAASVWITTDWAGRWIANKDGDIPGHDIHITVKCSALGPPYRPCVLPLRYGFGIDNARDVITQAENLGLIVRKGAWYAIAETEEKAQGIDGLSELLKEKPALLVSLEKKIREMLLE